MPGPFHTLAYPAGRAALRRGLAFPAKAPGDQRRYTLDMAAFVQDAASTIASVTLQADPTLQVTDCTWTRAAVTVTVAGGNAGAPTPALAFAIQLATGEIETVTVFQPVQPLDPPVPPGAVGVQSLPSRLVDDFGTPLSA